MAWITLAKASDEARINTAVLADDAELTFAMAASTKYLILGEVWFDTTAAGDYQYSFTAPASPTLVRFERIDATANGTPAARVIDTATPGATARLSGSTSGGYVRISVIFQNGVNAGTFAIQFAQNTQTNDTGAIHRAGSYLMYTTV